MTNKLIINFIEITINFNYFIIKSEKNLKPKQATKET